MTKVDPKLVAKYPQLFGPHTFAPKDLLALLKNLDNGIQQCEQNIKEENEKRTKYKVHWVLWLWLENLFSNDSYFIRLTTAGELIIMMSLFARF